VSFFDEGDPPRRSPRPQPRRPGGETVTVDPQTIRTRQGIAIGVGILVFILLAIGVRGCLNSAKKRGLREYARNVGELIASSDKVGKDFFGSLAGGTGPGNSLNLEQQVNGLRVESEDIVKRARRLDVPDEMRPAQGPLVLVLEMRRDALEKIASKLPSAQASGTTAEDAVVQIAGQMQLFYASDILYKYRVRPGIEQALQKADVQGESVADTNFFPYAPGEALDPAKVGARLGATLSAVKRGGPVAPGSHGHGLTSVSVNGQDLSADEANRITAGSNLTFTVKFQNQGENDEAGVVVKLSIEGAGAPVTAQATVPQTTKQSESSVDIPLRQAPPIGTPVTIKVAIDPVPGEKVIDNNTKAYPALFSRG
jgi:hypothetical protein